MSDALWISNLVLWIVVLALAAVVAALVRQIGVLHERLRPVGALTLADAPEVGSAAPRAMATDLTGAAVAVGGPDPGGRDTLLFFLSPTCPVCKALLPVVASLGRREHLHVILASDGPRQEHADFVVRERLALPYVLGTELGLAYRVGKLPWAALIGADGVLRAQGLVNTREHLESLLEAKARGVASLQEYLGRESKGAA